MVRLDPCHNYYWLNDTSRSILSQKPKDIQCDKGLNNSWYRFGNTNLSQVIETKCPTQYGQCDTLSGGWMRGSHPLGTENHCIDYFNSAIQ